MKKFSQPDYYSRKYFEERLKVKMKEKAQMEEDLRALEAKQQEIEENERRKKSPSM